MNYLILLCTALVISFIAMDFRLNSKVLTMIEQAELLKEFSINGLKGCVSYFQRKAEHWKTVPLKIGVTGSSGVGKSSFINTIRGLYDSEYDGYAPVSVVESTVACTEYPHPNNAMLKFWDLPGVGTPKFPKDTYLKKIGVNSYDCFVIMTSSRFTETDAWLAQEIRELGKPFYFVRAKIHQDILNDKRVTKRGNHSEENVVKEIRQNTVKKLKTLGISKNVFLIDNHEEIEVRLQQA